MKEIINELYFRFYYSLYDDIRYSASYDKYHWCYDLFNNTSTDIGNFIKDDFFNWDLRDELEVFLK